MKKYFSKQYLAVYYVFSVAGTFLYLLRKDDMQLNISNSMLVVEALFFGLFVAAAITAGVWLLISAYKQLSRRRRRKRKEGNAF